MSEAETTFKKDVRIASVCYSNNNRSMELHKLLEENGYNVKSYGTGREVRMPGKSIDKPVAYPFGTPYEKMYNEIKDMDVDFFSSNGILDMLERNMKIKLAPVKFQTSDDKFDLIITVDDKVYEAAVEHLQGQESETYEPVHVVNMDVKDTHEEAEVSGQILLKLVETLSKNEEWGDELEDILEDFGAQNDRTITHTTCFY
eukprot:TRINITY_DN25504_c0_g1_i1.p1 TRINITY_DN25504_c0_g1~~TRINITY_DN25504_c0_g1_i1.p1  ORF type:complete len:210 (+),score=66.59 TRINITY_DN25504_c0_g1_i1:28-630(+)